MPLFKVEIFKQYQNENWANVYHLRAADIDEAASGVPILVAAERAIHLNTTEFVSARVADIAEGTDVFYSIPLGGFGSVGPGEAALPLWNTIRVDFAVTGGGRPSRKFYRGRLDETASSYLTVVTAVANQIDTELTDMITDLAANGTPYVDVDDQLVNNAVVYPRVQMRQLHRKRRRAATPA